MSGDGLEANAAFAQDNGFSYPLLCDTTHAVLAAYGAIRPLQPIASLFGKRLPAKRIAVLISAAGLVERTWTTVDPRSFPEDAIGELEEAAKG